MQGKVIGLCLSLENKQRKNTNEIYVKLEGILDDKFFGKDIQRSILISSTESYDLMKKNGIYAEYGSLGENIIIDINPYNLSAGTKIEIGTAVIEITQSCTICNSLALIDTKVPSLLQNDRGIFAKTVQSGKICKGDSVRII